MTTKEIDPEENEISAMWAEHREKSQKKRACNRENAAQILDESGISYTSHNNGVHLVVKGDTEIIDFWPGTGNYVTRTHQTRGRGIFNLLRNHLGAQYVPPSS